MDSTALLASIRRRAATASASATGSADSDLLAYVTEEQRVYMLPTLVNAQAEHLIPPFDYDVTLTPGTAAYRLPYRAAFNRLREVSIISSGRLRNLKQAALDRLEEWGDSSARGAPEFFCLRGSQLILLPTPDAADTLRMTYAHRPSALTATAGDYNTILSFSGPELLTTTNHGWTTASRLDFIKATSPYEVISIDVAPTAASTNSIDLSAEIEGLEEGDYVALAGKTPVPQMPEELHPLLALRAAYKWLANNGFLQEAQAAAADLVDLEQRTISMLSPRVDGEPKIATPGPNSLLGGLAGPSGWPWRSW